jgi:hypothetical protein
MEDNRNTTITYLRVFATLAIVLYHCFCFNCGEWNFIFHATVRFYKPAVLLLCAISLCTFCFISGYLYGYLLVQRHKYANTLQFIKSKFKRLLIPYLIWGCIILYLFKDNTLSLLQGISHLWFLLMLFEVFTIMAITRKIWSRFSLKGSIFVLLLSFVCGKIYFLTGHCIWWLSFDNVVTYLPYFYLGIIIAKFNVVKYISKQLTMTIFSFSIVLSIWFSIINPSSNQNFDFLYLVPITISLYTLIDKGRQRQRQIRIKSIVTSRFIFETDKLSMAIYILHHIYIWLLLFYIPTFQGILDKHYILMPILLFCFITSISFYSAKAIYKTRFSKILFG